MACVENIPPANVDSEREEGEIVDELDDLSDISSEEEFLLRQRLEVLENYNNVLERKKAKNTTVVSGKTKRREDSFPYNFSEISAAKLEDGYPHINYKDEKQQRYLRSHHKSKRRKETEPHIFGRSKDYKKKNSHSKKRLEIKIISESSEESDDEYRNRRRKLADAVVVNKEKNDTSSLKVRLNKMLYGPQLQEPTKSNDTENKQIETGVKRKVENVTYSPIAPTNTDVVKTGNDISNVISDDLSKVSEFVNLCTDDEDKSDLNKDNSQDNGDIIMNENNNEKDISNNDRDSDEDLELLRQYALKTKASKIKADPIVESETKPANLSEDEDAELRAICLQSALLKRAFEIKQKQKLKKRLSQSSNLQDELFNEQDELLNQIDSNNNTDIESVDMDIGSDADEKGKDLSNDLVQESNIKDNNGTVEKGISLLNASLEDELEEDEDLLRAKLLTSLSKNLPNLVDPNIINSIEDVKKADNDIPVSKNQTNVPIEKRFIINLGESDSEGENEATKNLTLMHMKLSEQPDFQQKLDLFLKSTRMEVEKNTLPDVVQKPPAQPSPKPTEKFVPKAVNHLPKSKQIEYKNLVKRIAELEKIKQARQAAINLVNKPPVHLKETLKPRNFSIDSNKSTIVKKNLDEQIALSRKKIAEESTKILYLKEEARKLSQKYKIVATELRNITTAITLNKKEQKVAQNKLTKIRAQHQFLLNSSTSTHSKTNGHLPLENRPNKIISITKLQKENDPTKEEYRNPQILKSVKVSVVNDLNEDKNLPNPILSVHVDVSSNKKIVKLPKSPTKDRIVDLKKDHLDSVATVHKDDSVNNLSNLCIKENDADNLIITKVVRKKSSKEITNICESERRDKDLNDYESPLQALNPATWDEDPNAVLCPFEVGGNCKDPHCKYIHP